MRNCPLCDDNAIRVVLDLGIHPLADTFLPIARRGEPEFAFPLVLVQCESCFHFYSAYPTDPHSRYVANDYSYESANSDLSLRHFEDFAAACKSEIQKEPSDGNFAVLDIGSNDGTLLNAFRNLGAVRLLGVDPSPNMARLAVQKDLRTEVCFFSPENVAAIIDANEGRKFELIVSANVVNHADNPHLFLEAIEQTLADDGLFVFEVPNVVDLVEFRAFETVYHEHVHYWSVETLRRLLSEHGFRICRLDVLDYMCGSIRVFASRVRFESPDVGRVISSDRRTVLGNREALENFSKDVLMTKFKTLEFLYSSRALGKRVIAIGAATKGNTLLNYYGLGPDEIEYITDKAQEKIGKFTPGSRIPIVSDDTLRGEPPGTVALILPWNLDNILRDKFSSRDFKFVTPQKDFGNSIGRERAGIYGKA